MKGPREECKLEESEYLSQGGPGIWGEGKSHRVHPGAHADWGLWCLCPSILAAPQSQAWAGEELYTQGMV